ncbi:MAG: hypothetical protein K8M05_40355 [Deltaproteobacteria bacterium]|nr:hypothetical protein [Kofleriaceae bacterium]
MTHRNLRLSTRLGRMFLAAATTAALVTPPAVAQPAKPGAPAKPIILAEPTRSFAEIVADVADMVSDREAQTLVQKRGLGIVNVMWEDTGRWEGSAVGPNISDVTIEVEASNGADGRRTYLMPVIRHDNFSDKTADVRMDRIFIPVGNARGKKLETITLTQLLANPGRYMSAPRKGKIKGSLLAPRRDKHVLASAQHAFLPVPRDGKATFWPVIFNYQSYAENPAVLTILVTRQGASMTIIDNDRDTVDGGGSWGQRLYFNQDGQKAPLIAERLKDVQRKGATANGEDAASLGEDANLLMLIQVPLKQKRVARMAYGAGGGGIGMADGAAPPMEMSAKSAAAPGRGRASDVDVAVLGHGPTEGPYTELDDLTIERDPRFPVRVTVQFYQATSNGVVSNADIARMSEQIDKVYAKGDYVGSLVVPSPHDRKRPTNWDRAFGVAK